eukprot:249550-Karenia_brevis.AAC.1
MSGGSNLASVGVGHCLGLAVQFGGYDWIRQTRTNNILFATEYATTDSGTPLNAGNDVFSDPEDDDETLIRADVQSLTYISQQVARGWQHGSGSSSSGRSLAGGDGGGGVGS